MLLRKPYEGLTRKLVLAFDVGTTFGGVSYCILDPGEVPMIRGVSKVSGHLTCVFLAHSMVADIPRKSKSAKYLPSIIYHDLQGEVRAVGTEALQEHIIEQAE
jgi:hypothetical protein